MNELDLFAAAIALSHESERAAMLDRECAGQPELRARLDQLIAAHLRSYALLDAPAAMPTVDHSPSDSTTVTPRAAAEAQGNVIAGRYKLLEEIGEGGMGTVWVAEQTQPVKRKVALKLIKAGMDSRQVLARFEAERQALAVMVHPNIAKVLDGGLTDAGRPFFVMEYVKGVPITEYCDAVRASVPDRLNLFVQVCQAVQHAHQKGIIHRDLKPSNILVAPYDDKPVPKVIDFGLAKAMHQSLTEHTLHTAHETVLGTPLYMSPEQAQLNNLDIDTRSDIYSLGVLLYELLTGTTPLERQRFKQAAWDEIKRLIREEEPPKPSTRLSSTDTLPSLAASRQTEPVRLTRQVRGDLDWIVMKALEKDRTRRYETANGFAADLGRYLTGEPVLAAPPSAAYRMKKFARKHRAGLATTAAIGLLIVGGTGMFLVQQTRYARAMERKNAELAKANIALDQQRKRAEQREQQAIDAVKRFGDIVAGNAELKHNPSLQSLRKALFKEPLSFFTTLRDQLQKDRDTRPESLAKLASSAFQLGRLVQQIGDKEDALHAYEESLAIQESLARDNPGIRAFQRDLAGTLLNIGNVQDATGHLDEAIRSLNRARVILEALANENPDVAEFRSDLANCLNNFGTLQQQTGELDPALISFEKSRTIRERLMRENPKVANYRSELAGSYYNIAYVHHLNGRSKEALKSWGNAKGILEELVRDHPDINEYLHDLADCQNNIGFQQSLIGNSVEALKWYNASLGIRKVLARENPSDTLFQSDLARLYSNIGLLQSETGHQDEAQALYKDSLEIRARLVRFNPSDTMFLNDLADSYHDIGLLQKATGHRNEARASFRDALDIEERLVRLNPRVVEFQGDLAGTLCNMAAIDQDERRWSEARESLNRAVGYLRIARIAEPLNPQLREGMRNALKALSEVELQLQNPVEAAEARRELAELDASDPAKAALDTRLTVVIGGAAPKDNAERLALAQRAYDTRRFALAARLWTEALDADPKLADDRQTQHRYNAACAAAVASAGEGEGEPPLDDVAKTKLRNQALQYLQAELEAWSKLLESGNDEQRAVIAKTLNHWRNVDTDLAGIRDESELAKLPESEQAAFRILWSMVDELLEKAGTEPATEPKPTKKQ